MIKLSYDDNNKVDEGYKCYNHIFNGEIDGNKI